MIEDELVKHKSASCKMSISRSAAEGMEELKTAAAAKSDEQEQIKTLPLCSKALVHDIVQFDLEALEFLHKLGEGGFGTVRACKFGRSGLRAMSSGASSSTAASQDSSDDGTGSCASVGEEQKVAATMPSSKFAAMKTGRLNNQGAPKETRATSPTSLLDQAMTYRRQATEMPERDHRKIYAVKIISKHKVLQSQ